MSLLEVEVYINVYYGAIHAIKGISFSVDEGEVVTLIGDRRGQIHHAEHRRRTAPPARGQHPLRRQGSGRVHVCRIW